MKTKILNLAIIIILTGLSASCNGYGEPAPGAYMLDQYKSIIQGKNVAVVANQTSMVGEIHLVDKLLLEGIKIKVIFSPEHGFRNMADAGESVADGRDPETGIALLSLYGSHKKPAPEDLDEIDIVIFDIQDVGVRFYTYISTLQYVMEACAENSVKCLILDRPNPNGFYVDGNILDTAFKSFVGLNPIPIVHGMTVGEYATMLNGEKWLKNGEKCDLTVIKCRNYDHETYYDLPVKPSPNLPNQTAIYLYPSICFFEGTNVSLGRGTSLPFQVYGSPDLPDLGFSFTPESVPGAKNPPLLGIKCYGKDLSNAIEVGIVPRPEINLDLIIDAYTSFRDKEKFFTDYFDVLAGGPLLREQIQKGMSAREIRATWRMGLEKFGVIRDKYLLYR
ncbi:MAG TPA: DUF1343 domain-containing protein [Bacteroidales bacterium]|nr:DUF1343 domain-containing protein [Bacteroidales bacterium]